MCKVGPFRLTSAPWPEPRRETTMMRGAVPERSLETGDPTHAPSTSLSGSASAGSVPPPAFHSSSSPHFGRSEKRDVDGMGPSTLRPSCLGSHSRLVTPSEPRSGASGG